MRHMRLRTAAIIIACIIVGGFILSVPRARDGAKLPASEVTLAATPPVSLHDVFKKGVHTITGSVMAPNACSTVSATASLVGDAAAPSGIVVAVALSQSEGVCLQLPTKNSFTTTITAPANLSLAATVNGANATTTVL